MKNYLKVILILGSFLLASGLQAQVKVEGSGSRWQLTVDGQPYFVKGVTYSQSNPALFDQELAEIKALGANTIRNWGVGDSTPQLLDAAEKHGLKVMLGLWLRHGRAGREGVDNFNYVNDRRGMDTQRRETLEAVRKYKDHPALLLWGVGNEVVLNISTEEEKIAYARFLESLTQEIKKIDPNHPVSSVSAYTVSVPYWAKYTPSLDIYGINAYGYSTGGIVGSLREQNALKPYMVTEYGATGEWETPADASGIHSEPDDQHKYDIIAKGWGDMIERHKGICLGGFVFHYTTSIDHTSLWLGLKSGEFYRPPYWATREAFTGQKPDNYPPQIRNFMIRNQLAGTRRGEWVRVRVQISDRENDKVDVSFHYCDRTGPREIHDRVQPLEFRALDREGDYEIKIPESHGNLKIYVFADDAAGNRSTATQNFVVRR